MATPIINPKLKEHVISGIYNRQYTKGKLPDVLYSSTAKQLHKGIYKGYGKHIQEVRFNTVDYKMLSSMRENIYMFSAAKTYQQVKEMSGMLYEGNKLLPYADFRDKVSDVFDQYNEDWLKSEYETSISMASASASWQRIQESKDALPYLMFSGSEDEVECDICEAFDGITLPVDDPFWDEAMPPQHFNCRCFVESVGPEGEDDLSDEEDLNEATGKANEAGWSDLFKTNPGKTGIVFKDEGAGKHPYFEVSPADIALAQANFNLPIPHPPDKPR